MTRQHIQYQSNKQTCISGLFRNTYIEKTYKETYKETRSYNDSVGYMDLERREDDVQRRV